MTGARVRVLVVDDSAFARKVVREVLEAEPDLQVVGSARDGLEALEKIAELAPDVLTLDLSMPGLDGLGVLGALAGRPRPRVVVVSTVESDSERGLAALEAGAVELVRKPTAFATGRLIGMAGELVRAVRAAATARSPEPWKASEAPLAAPPAVPRRRLVVLGASTGGPQALTRVLKALPGDFPAPVALVVHLPPGYTAPFAERLDRECALRVREAEPGLELVPGLVVVARAGVHLKVRAGAHGELTAALDPAPADALHRPSVDELFASAARATGAATLAAVLTGMGQDGLAGARLLRQAGADVLTETEASCVVYGMPRAVWEAGLATAEAPLSRMAAAIIARL